jgi:hypothetical protein
MAVLAYSPVKSLAADGEEGSSDGNRPTVSTSLSLEKIERSDIDGSDASTLCTELSAGLEWQFLLFDIDHRKYDWRESASLGIGSGLDPWKTLTRIAPGLQYYREFSKKWGVWAKLVAFAGFEDEISSRSWTYNPQVLGFYMPTRLMTLYGGLGMLYHPVDLQAYPVFGIAWNMGSKDGLAGALGFPETMVRYGLNERVGLKIDFEWDIRTYSLAENNNLVPEGYVNIEDLMIGLQLEYKPIKGLMLSCGLRQYFSRKLTVFDQEEDELSSYDVSESLAYLLGIEYEF